MNTKQKINYITDRRNKIIADFQNEIKELNKCIDSLSDGENEIERVKMIVDKTHKEAKMLISDMQIPLILNVGDFKND